MKTATGMIRSKAMMQAKPKLLMEMHVKPMKGGGLSVTHEHSEHPPETHEFNHEQEGEFADHMAAHGGQMMQQHSGMSWHDGAGDGNEVNKEGTEAE